ncbi:hypothetical protein [Dyadobacter sp. CY356]|uniref:hypothetical protein n=1 Tax=Dyadobacter sp. CY356 TaxID=2906442 RepID=UPI001F2E148C|nr:hypothetical protein [Dyadobacter sp. CY356]MCF0057809.1 hypothetical protein [Dyadobacter sp. CY356]
MTNGETLFVVAFTMVLLLGPFALMIYFLLKHSKETNSIFSTPRTFQTSVFDYFFSLDIIFGAYLAVMGTLIFSSLIRTTISAFTVHHWWVYVTFFTVIGIMIGGSFYILYLSFNYWKHTRNVILSFEPETKTIFIQTPSKEYIIREHDIKKVEVFTNDNYKMPFCYYRLNFTSGEELILTSKTKGVLWIFEYFNKIPREEIIKRFPIIR